MKTNKTLMAMLAVGGLLAISPMLRAADTNTPANTPPPARAPGARPGGRMMGPNLDQLAKDLNLTDDQKAKVKTILDDQRTKMQELRSETDQSARRTKMQAIRTDTNNKLKEVLSADQYAQWEKMGPGQGMRQRRNNKPADDNKTQQ